MNFKRYYVYLRINNEKTGDSIIASSRLNAAHYFSKKKQINLKDWIKIFTIKK